MLNIFKTEKENLILVMLNRINKVCLPAIILISWWSLEISLAEELGPHRKSYELYCACAHCHEQVASRLSTIVNLKISFCHDKMTAGMEMPKIN